MGLIQSLKYAWAGLRAILRSEQNARIHLVVAVLVLALSFYLGVTPAEQAAVFFAIIIVFLAEIFNTAMEKTLDLVDPKANPQVAAIKDMLAAGVLVASVGAAVVGLVILWPYILEQAWLH